jgi:hypothetical protein
MRYLALLGISCISMILTACISPALPIFGAQLDFLLAVMVCMVLLEKTMTPVFYIAAAAVWMDAFFAKALGFYVLQYLLSGVCVYIFARKRSVKMAEMVCTAAAAWVLREWLGVIFCFLMDAPVGLGSRMIHSILPGLLPQVLLSMGIYYCMDKLYRHRFIWPVAAFMDRS